MAPPNPAVNRPLVIPDEFRDYSGPSLQGQYAGFVSRTLAFGVDMLIVFVISTLISLTALLFLSYFGLLAYLQELLAEQTAYAALLRALAAVGSFGFVAFLYSTIIITITGGLSLGRGLLGVRVVRLDGQPIHYLRAVRRYLAFYLALLPLGLGLLWVTVDDRRQGWHDKLSGTCVIYDWPAQESGSVLQRMRARLDYVRESTGRVRDGEDTPANPEIASGGTP